MVSVIIPVLNVGAYLSTMLSSVISQSEKELEIIIINDKSSDNTEEICRGFLKKDERIRLLFGDGKGVSSARNIGIRESRGEYLLFLDGDDFVNEDMIKALLLPFKNDRDILFSSCAYEKIKDGHLLNEKDDNFKWDLYETGKITADEFLNKRLFLRDTKNYQGYVWNKLFRADIIKKKDLTFDEDIFYNEDRLFITRYIALGREISNGIIHHENRPLYRYELRDDSAIGREKDHFLSEREVTELTAFERMLPFLKGEETREAREKATYEMCGAVLRKFYRMTDKKDIKRYKKSAFRHFARKFPYLKYKPRDYLERVLILKILLYGIFGISFGNRG